MFSILHPNNCCQAHFGIHCYALVGVGWQQRFPQGTAVRKKWMLKSMDAYS